MGALFAPFTQVAAANPHASAPVERSAAGTDHADRGEPADRRPVHPLHRRPREGQPGRRRAADVGRRGPAAWRPADRWVFLHGHADLRERDLLDRADLSASPASAHGRPARPGAWRASAPDELATIDLYSCFPIAGVQHLRRPGPDRRTIRAASPSPAGCRSSAALGNNYSMHAIAETVQRARAQRPAATGWSAPTAAS